MGRFREYLTRLLNAFRGRPLDRDMEAELQFHVQLAVEDGVRRGLSLERARREARLNAGSVTGALEDMRDQRGLGWLEGAIADLRHAVVALVRHRGFASIATAALALAVAMNTLIFMLLDGVIFKPLPYPESTRLIRVFESGKQFPKFPVSIGNFLEFRRLNRTLESIALYTGEDLQLMHGEKPERLPSVRISSDFLPTLGIAPLLGRNFTEAEMRGEHRVVILSNQLWRTRFNGDPGIVGRTIRLNRAEWTVAGVMPAGFQHIGGAYRSPLQGESVAIWWPLRVDLDDGDLRAAHFTNAVARLKPGVTLAQAGEDFKRMALDLRQRFPNYDANLEMRISPLASEVVGKSRDTVWLLVLAGSLVLLIACTNVAGLCIARGLARRKEIAVRQALGAGAWRLMRVVLCENVVLGVAGGIAGLALAAGASPVWRALLPPDFPRVHEVTLTYSAAAFAVLSAIATSVLAGLAPAIRQTRTDPVLHLNQDSRSASAGSRTSRLRVLLVTSQVAFAAVLCTAAALLLESSARLEARHHGFESRGVLTFSVALPGSAYSKPEQVRAFIDDVTARWRQLPGVRAAAFASNVPWTGWDENTSFDVPGRKETPGDEPHARFQMASPGYFNALRIPLRAGRVFDSRDRDGSAPVVVINDSLAKHYLEGENPIGKSLEVWGKKRQVVGVVADIFDYPAEPNAEPAFWFPLSQMPRGELVAVLRTDGDPMTSVRAAAHEMRQVDRELPLADIKTMDDIARAALGERSLANWLFQAFAILALGLAVFGIYGLLAYTVEQRHKEFGIRMALGATRSQVAALVLRNGAMQAAAGALLGLLLAPIAAKSLASLLFGVTPFAPMPLVAAPLLILTASIAASLFPAIAAARAHPGSTLRE